MIAVDILTEEHQLMRRMISVCSSHLQDMQDLAVADTDAVEAAVDFFRMFVCDIHTRKEECILFRAISTKNLFPEEQRLMHRLLQEHIWAKQAVDKLDTANNLYKRGRPFEITRIVYQLDKLITLYVRHVRDEEHYFFRPLTGYFSEAEQQKLLDGCLQFDRCPVKLRYTKLVEQQERLTTLTTSRPRT